MTTMLLAALLIVGSASDPRCGSLDVAVHAFDDAQLHHDRGTIERFLAPDFQYVTRVGIRLGRREFITATATPGEVFAPFVIRDHRIEALGVDGGVASGDVTVTGTHAGAPISDRFRYADVFTRHLGCWTVVYTQVTSVPSR